MGYSYKNSVFINVSVSDLPQILMPKIFSPNGDNINDNFTAQSNEEILQMNLLVFDRWGNNLF